MPPSLVKDKGDTRVEIRYRLVAKLPDNQVVPSAKEVLTVTREMNAVEIVTIRPEHRAKLKSMCFIDRGQVSISAEIEKDAYSPGETIKITAKVNNSESNLAVSALVANLYREINVLMYSDNRIITEEIVNSSKTPVKIPSGRSLMSIQTVEMGLKVRESNGDSFTTPTVSGKLVKCRYRVDIWTEMSGCWLCCGDKARAIVPVIIFKKPFREKVPEESIEKDVIVASVKEAQVTDLR